MINENKEEVKLQKQILKSLILLSIPTILEQILTTLLQYVDTAMVGRLGEAATASVNITTTITWLVGSVDSAIGVAVIALISRNIGAKDKETVKKLSMQSFILVILAGIVLGLPSILLSGYIPKWMGAEKDICPQASIYFLIISIPMIFRAASTILGAAIRATKDTKTPMYIGVATNIINIALNFLLIYGLKLGVTGAAIATAASYVFSGIAMYIAYRKNQELYWHYRELKIDLVQMKAFAKVGIPVLASSFVACMGYVVFARLVSKMGTTIFAAHSIAVTAETIFYIPGYGLRTATSTLIGISLGEGDKHKFETVTRLSIAITMAMMIINGIILYVVAYPLMSLLTSSKAVAAIGANVLKMVAFSEPFFGLMIVVEGIFYGLGKTRYSFIVETIGMWGIRILFTALCVNVWNLGLYAVWYCMIADNICKAIMFTIPVITKKSRQKLFLKGE